MPGKMNTKLKLLYLVDILEKKTDEEHPLSANALCDMMIAKGVDCERKSIYKDVEVLRHFGYDIILSNSKKTPGYFMGERKFELAELRLLSDAVQAADFITPKKTEKLVSKIESFASEGQAKMLHSQVYVEKRRKSTNEEIYYTISLLHDAINAGVKVNLIYTKRKFTGTYRVQKEEKAMVVNPYALIWSNDHYYLICNNVTHDNLMHLRIDRIHTVELTNEPCRHFSEVSKYKEKFDVADYSAKLFNMFSGEPMPVDIVCDNTIIDPILDKFGEKIKLIKVDDEHFALKTYAVVNEGLAGWVMNYGGKIKVRAPYELIHLVKESAKATLANYAEDEEK